MTEFKGKVALSTGAASGMGLLFTQNVASLGGDVVFGAGGGGILEIYRY